MNSIVANTENVFSQLVGEPLSSPPFTPAQRHNHDGLNSDFIAAAGGGALRLIESLNVASTVTSFDFSATLDGDTDEQYIITGFWRLPGSSTLELRWNGLNSTLLLVTPAATTHAFFHTWIKAKSDADSFLDVRYIISTFAHDAPTVSGTVTGDASTPGVGTNITSLGLRSSAASGIVLGSRFSLYKLLRV